MPVELGHCLSKVHATGRQTAKGESAGLPQPGEPRSSAGARASGQPIQSAPRPRQAPPAHTSLAPVHPGSSPSTQKQLLSFIASPEWNPRHTFCPGRWNLQTDSSLEWPGWEGDHRLSVGPRHQHWVGNRSPTSNSDQPEEPGVPLTSHSPLGCVTNITDKRSLQPGGASPGSGHGQGCSR